MHTLPSCPVPGCPLPIDLLIEPSDKKRLGAHKKHLEIFNTTFPRVSLTTHLIKLPETYDVLAFLLVFSHYEYQELEISVSGLRLDTVLTLAMVADKYGNYSAGVVARDTINSLGRQSAENALRVIPYKMIYSEYTDMDEILSLTMYSPFSAAWEVMEPYPDVFSLYVTYRIQWKYSFLEWKTQVDTISTALKSTDSSFAVVKHILETARYPSVDVVDDAERLYFLNRMRDQVTSNDGPTILKTWEHLFFDKLRERAMGFKTWEEFVRSPRWCYYELEPAPTEYFTRWDWW